MAEIRVNATGELKLYDSDDSNYVSFKSAGTVSSNVAWTLPSADGSSGQMLSTNGSGTLSWATASSADPTSADGDSLGTASAEWSDLFLADGGIIKFGNDQDITLTHNADTGLTLNGVMVATTVEPSADTSSGDNAAIGYTAAEGLILTGQGSTGDVTIKNDADTVVAYVPTGADDLLFPDNAKLIFGTGSDFTIVHDGSNTKLTDAGTGSLYIQASDNIVLRSADEGETFLTCADDGAVKLYNNYY